MKKCISIIVALLLCRCVYAQYTLEDCQTMARENYPLIKQYELIEKVAEYNIVNAKRAWLPQITLSGQASYQNDVVSFPDEMTNVFEMVGITLNPLHKDQYRVSLDVSQIIWDGGYTKAKKEAEMADMEVMKLSNETDLYALEERINQIYFGILTLKEQEKQARLREKLLEENRNVIATGAANGVAAESDFNLIEAELLANQQYITRIKISMNAYIKILSLMTGIDIQETAVFEKPAVPVPSTRQILRPELKLFDARLSALEIQKKISNTAVMPKFSFFAQGLYGYPGFNMFEDMLHYQWSWNYIVGLRFQWNVSSFYTKKNNIRNIEVNKNMVNVQKERFIYENNLQQSQTNAAINQMLEIMQDDDRIIELRTKIRIASESKWQNGIITMSELLKDITNETNARLDKSIHELEWLKKIYELKSITNN